MHGLRRVYRPSDILVLPDDLRAFAWSAPMRDLAAKLDLSDVGLKKLLASYGVSPPPQGYWNKVRAGKPVLNRPKAPPRGPGEAGRIRVDARFANMLSPARPLAPDGPFASPLVPEDLDELYEQELRAIGRAGVPKALDGVHRGLAQLLKDEKRRHEKVAARSWHWDTPKFDTPLARRRLRILDGIFKALSKRGHDGDAYEQNGELHARAVIGDTFLALDIVPAGSHRTLRLHGRLQPDPALPASTPLVLRLRRDFGREVEQSWQDDQTGTLETKIAPITAGIIVAGEAAFRRSLREAAERAEQQRLAEGKRRQEERAELSRQRLQHLRTSGELLRQAEDIRVLVARVRQAMLDGSAKVDAPTLEAWEAWALAEADKIDPVRSGQIMSHLKEPL
jgi:hypothetical protein